MARLATLQKQASLAAMPAFRLIFATMAASADSLATAVRDFTDPDAVRRASLV